MTAAKKLPVAPDTAADAIEEWPALEDMLAAKREFSSIKMQAFRELKLFSRKLLGVALLTDDLAGLASLDEAAAKVRLEHAALLAERDQLTASVVDLRATAKTLTESNAALGGEADQLTERVAELDRERRQLEPTVQSYNATATARSKPRRSALLSCRLRQLDFSRSSASTVTSLKNRGSLRLRNNCVEFAKPFNQRITENE
jgi:DNA repair exonuclease SbcCD ATPase subunit